jgi:hypothetical protein
MLNYGTVPIRVLASRNLKMIGDPLALRSALTAPAVTGPNPGRRAAAFICEELKNLPFSARALLKCQCAIRCRNQALLRAFITSAINGRAQTSSCTHALSSSRSLSQFSSGSVQ